MYPATRKSRRRQYGAGDVAKHSLGSHCASERGKFFAHHPMFNRVAAATSYLNARWNSAASEGRGAVGEMSL
jgi:hypothetical protein